MRPPVDWGCSTFASGARSAGPASLAAYGPDLSVFATHDHREVLTWTSAESESRHDGDQLQLVGDTPFVVSGSSVDRLCVHDLVTGDLVVTVLTHGRRSGPFAVSPDGRRLTVAEMDAVVLYEIRTPEAWTFPTVHRGVVESCDLSADGERVAWLAVERDSRGVTRSEAGVTRTATGETRPLTSVTRHSRTYRPDVRVSSSVRLLADGSVCVQEPLMGLHPTRTTAGTVLPPESGRLVDDTAFVVTPPARFVREYDATVVVVDAAGASFRVPAALDSQGDHGVFLRCSAGFAGESKLSVDAGSGRITVAEPSDGWHFLGLVHPGESTDEFTVRLRSTTKEPIRVELHEVLCVPFEVDPRTKQYDLRHHHPVAFSPDLQRMWGFVSDEVLHAWGVPGGDRQYAFRDVAQAVHFGPHRLRGLSGGVGRIVVGASTGQVVVLDTADGRVLSKVSGPGGEISSQALSSDESWFVAGTDRGRVAAWNVDGEPFGIADATDRAVTAATILDDDGLVATGTADGVVVLWSVSQHGWTEQLRLGPFGGAVRELRCSSTGETLACLIAGEHTVRVLDLARLEADATSMGLPPLPRTARDVEQPE